MADSPDISRSVARYPTHMRKTILLIAAILFGCAATPTPAPDNRIGKDFTPPPRGALVVVIPPSEPNELEQGESRLMAQLNRQLKAAGYRVATLTRANYSELWAKYSAEVGGVFDPATGEPRLHAYAKAMSMLAQTVCEQAGCELLLIPSLARRSAALEGTHAEWDGVRQNLRLMNSLPEFSYRTTGSMPAWSVNVLALTKAGRLAFNRHGGVTLAFDANLRKSKLEPRASLFSNEQEVADAVRIALEPIAN